jgi:hypothetical protein
MSQLVCLVFSTFMKTQMSSGSATLGAKCLVTSVLSNADFDIPCTGTLYMLFHLYWQSQIMAVGMLQLHLYNHTGIY